jgi:hypothetical protein
VHKSAFPPKETKSPTGGCAQIKLLQYAPDVSKIYPLIKALFLPRGQTSRDTKKTSLQRIFMSHI